MAKHSTLKLIMGNCAAYQRKRDGTLEEVPSVYEVSNGRGKFEGNRFTTARFWKNISTRYWQFDDFKFHGAAAASFLGNAHRFKIWFNPLESYKLLMRAALDLHSDKETEREMGGNRGKRGRKPVAKDATLPSEEDIQKENEKAEKEWESVLNNTHPKCAKLQANYGWSPNLYKELVESEKTGEWTDRGWELWCVSLVSCDFLFTNVTAIMIHEEQHIILNHLNRNGKRDPYQMNLAQDYAINQELDWSDEVKKVLITCDNETFFQRFIISYVKYLLITENDLRPEIEDKFGLKLVMVPGGDERANLQAFIDKALPQVDRIFEKYMLQGDNWNHTDKTAGKSSDFYYRVLMETMIFQGGSGNGKGNGKGNGGVRGYDGHGTWDEIADDDGEDGGGEGGGEEKDGEGKDGKGKGKGKDGEDEGEDSDFNKIKGKAQGGKIDQIRKAPKGSKAKNGGNSSGGEGEGKEGGEGSVANGSHVKDRGKGEGAGAEHAGFDVTTACSRQEIKASVRDALERAGLNPDDPEELARALGRIPGMGNLGTVISEFFKVPTKNWQQILANYLATSINAKEKDYTMSRENRRIAGVFPGQRRERGLDVIIAVDTSGSINYNDYNDFVGQIEKIVKDCDLTKVRLIQCHHTISFDKEVILSRIKRIPICETGGTTMRVVYEKLKKEGNRKLLILFTDGCIDDFLQKDYPGFKSIMFLSRGNGCYAKPLIDRGFKVISQDQE